MSVLKGFAVSCSEEVWNFFPTLEEALSSDTRSAARKLGLALSIDGTPRAASTRRKHHEPAMQLLNLENRVFQMVEVNIADVHALHETGHRLSMSRCTPLA